MVNRGQTNTNEYRALLKKIDPVTEHMSGLNRIERFERAAPAVAPAAVASHAIAESSDATREQKIDVALRSLLRHGHQPNAIEQRDVLTTNADGIALVLLSGSNRS